MELPCADEITGSYLRLIDLREPEVPAFIDWVKRVVNEQLTPDKGSPIGAVEGLFSRDVYTVEGFELMEWLIEHGVPLAGRSFINGFWAEAASTFRDRRISSDEINANARRLFARAKELDPRIERENYDEARAWVLN